MASPLPQESLIVRSTEYKPHGRIDVIRHDFDRYQLRVTGDAYQVTMRLTAGECAMLADNLVVISEADVRRKRWIERRTENDDAATDR